MVNKSKIFEITQQIIDKNFSSPIERKIIIHENRINFRCPYCLEGKILTKRRGNLYLNKLLYVCFNCGKKTNFDRFAKDFNLQIDPDTKLNIIEHLQSQISFGDCREDLMETEYNKLLNFSDLVETFTNGNSAITDFQPIKENTIFYNYLLSRGITSKYHSNIWCGKWWTSEEKFEPVLVLLNRKENKILGCQIRNLKEGKRRIFKILNYETLYKWIHNKTEIDDLDVNQFVIYNKLSYYFNILNVDFSKKITIFEGYLDSLFFPNSIGVVGTNTDMKFLEKMELDIQYFYDNDSAGNQKSEQKLKQGYSVFLWKKLFEDIAHKKHSSDPYGLMYRISKVKDLNKLAQLCENPFVKFELDNFFSRDILDIKWIPKVIKYFQRLK